MPSNPLFAEVVETLVVRPININTNTASKVNLFQ